LLPARGPVVGIGRAPRRTAPRKIHVARILAGARRLGDPIAFILADPVQVAMRGRWRRLSWLSALPGYAPLWLSALPGYAPLWLSALPGYAPLWLSALPGYAPLWLSALPGYALRHIRSSPSLNRRAGARLRRRVHSRFFSRRAEPGRFFLVEHIG
jgi:hypothetical protein